jgi:UDP-glucose 4-epimerase
MKVSKALVTGGAGFIGSHIVDELIRRNIETYVIDDLSTGSIMNIAQHKNNKMLHVHIGNIQLVDKILNNQVDKIDIVFHEAAIVSVSKSVSDPMLIHDINVTRTLMLMNFCVKNNVKRFIFASSAAIYGSAPNNYLSEDSLCIPSSPYGASKLSIENYLHAYSKTYGLESVILRYFNVFGPRQKYDSDYSGVITVFINKLLNRETPVIFGDGKQTRDFVHIKDIVQANILAMDSNDAAGGTFNISSGRATSILELLKILKALTGAQDIQTHFTSQRPGDIVSSVASINKARSSLKYSPRISMIEGLAETVSYIIKEKEITHNVVHPEINLEHFIKYS